MGVGARPSGVEMNRTLDAVASRALLGAAFLLAIGFPASAIGQIGVEGVREGADSSSSSSSPMILTAEHIEIVRETESYEAQGHVVFVQGGSRLTADRMSVRLLTGRLVATGTVHLSKEQTDVWADTMELNINTEAGLLANGTLYNKDTNATMSGQVVQRFSEDHYRIREGSFTNCNAMEGEVPAWRFTFEDADVDVGDSLFLKGAWFCVQNVPILPLPTFNYPTGVARKTGFLFPSPGYDSKFGLTYRQGFFWAFDPSQDLTLTPSLLGNRGYGGDAQYRYIFSRAHRGQWLVNALQDLDQDRGRALFAGSHSSQFTKDLSLRVKAFLVSDRTFLNDFSDSGALRALPSSASTLDLRQHFDHGNVYLLGRYLQPLEAGGTQTFQRLPEIGHRFNATPVLGTPLGVSMDSTFVHFFREKGFTLNRVDWLPGLSTRPIDLGHVINLTPQVKPRVTAYSRAINTERLVHRETIWSSLRASSRLRKRFQTEKGPMVTHTIEPDVMYEYVPPTDQSDIVQVDAVDDLPKKNVLTYSVSNRVVESLPQGGSSNLLELTLAQSYRVSPPQKGATAGPSSGRPQRFSDIWGRMVLGDQHVEDDPSRLTHSFLAVDAFLDPYDLEFSQINSDLRFQYRNHWYVQVGQRFTRSGNRVQRGDIWNPLSFSEVFNPTPEIQFLTAGAAVRLPLDVTLGAKVYRDFHVGRTSELDVVGLYQNPCRCWSAGFYFIQFPDRTQAGFMINLTGIGNTDSFGSELLKSLLNPLVLGEKGLPWN